MHLNDFADSLTPKDMTGTEEFASLLESARDLGIPHSPDVRYRSHQSVFRRMRFHFTEWGEPGAPQILLLHGGNQSCHSWDLVSLHLSDRFHVFALDQRGHGDSEWAADQDYSIDAKALDAMAFIGDQGLDSPIVMGHSMGGRITMTMAVQNPGFARGLVVVDVGPEISPEGAEVIHNFVVNNVEFDDLDEFVERVVSYDPFRSREHIRRTVKYNMLKRADGRYVSKVDHRRVPVSTSELTLDDVRSIDCPTLVVRGAQSNILDPEPAERFVAALPKGQLVTVDNAGHNVHGANTPGFLEVVGPFLEGVVS
jgi:pimeloyl-ACP methyl ester carboxylesterase